MTGRRVARFGTFDAERWWRPDDLAELPRLRSAEAHHTVAAMDEVLAAFCSPGDLLLTRGPMASSVRAGLAAAGITFDHATVAASPERLAPIERDVRRDEAALAMVAGCDEVEPYAVLADTAALADGLPSADVVAEVNSKAWSNELVRELGLPGAGTVVRSVADLSAAVTRTGTAVVVKDPFGVSGQGALAIDTPGVLRAVERTLDRQVAAGRRVELLVQEKYAVRRDFSTHVRITRDGHWRRRGVQVMTNRGFRHLGSGPADRELLELLSGTGYDATIDAVMARLAAAGYHGPVGVDSMLLVDGTVVPVLEVNARQSLGLLALVLDETVAERGLRAHLAQAELTVPQGRGIDDLAAALAGVRYDGGAAPGVVLLGGSGLAPPGGRVYFALMCRPDGIRALRQRFDEAVAAAGMRPRGGVRAA